MAETPVNDAAILDLLRKNGSLTISQFVDAIGVTATAVRQRLNRLLAQGLIQKLLEPAEGRGRPGHSYSLTEAGQRQAGVNFSDLAVVLWNEIRSIDDPQIRKGLLKRISERLAETYRDAVDRGIGIDGKMKELAEIFQQRSIPFEVERSAENDLPVLTALACPYPELAEQDRAVCSMERMLFSELLGQPVRLSECRLDGNPCCTFEATHSPTTTNGATT